MTKRINARIGDELARKLEQVRRSTNQTITEVVCSALELYCARVRREGAAHLLEESGFVGCGEAEADLSTTYKEGLDRSWSEKTGA